MEEKPRKPSDGRDVPPRGELKGIPTEQRLGDALQSSQKQQADESNPSSSIMQEFCSEANIGISQTPLSEADEPTNVQATLPEMNMPSSRRDRVLDSDATLTDCTQSPMGLDTEQQTQQPVDSAHSHLESGAPAWNGTYIMKRFKTNHSEDLSSLTQNHFEALMQQDAEKNRARESEASHLRNLKEQRQQQMQEQRKTSHSQTQPRQQRLPRKAHSSQHKYMEQQYDEISNVKNLVKDERDLQNFVRNRNRNGMDPLTTSTTEANSSVQEPASPLATIETLQNLPGIAPLLPSRCQAGQTLLKNTLEKPKRTKIGLNSNEGHSRCGLVKQETNKLTSPNTDVTSSNPPISAVPTTEVLIAGNTLLYNGAPIGVNGNNPPPKAPRRSRKTAHREEEMLTYGKQHDIRFIFKSNDLEDDCLNRASDGLHHRPQVHEKNRNDSEGKPTGSKKPSRNNHFSGDTKHPNSSRIKKERESANIEDVINSVVSQNTTTNATLSTTATTVQSLGSMNGIGNSSQQAASVSEWPQDSSDLREQMNLDVSTSHTFSKPMDGGQQLRSNAQTLKSPQQPASHQRQLQQSSEGTETNPESKSQILQPSVTSGTSAKEANNLAKKLVNQSTLSEHPSSPSNPSQMQVSEEKRTHKKLPKQLIQRQNVPHDSNRSKNFQRDSQTPDDSAKQFRGQSLGQSLLHQTPSSSQSSHIKQNRASLVSKSTKTSHDSLSTAHRSDKLTKTEKVSPSLEKKHEVQEQPSSVNYFLHDSNDSVEKPQSSQQTLSAAEALRNLVSSLPENKQAANELLKTATKSQQASNQHLGQKRSDHSSPASSSLKRPAQKQKRRSSPISKAARNVVQEQSDRAVKLKEEPPTPEERLQRQHFTEHFEEKQGEWTQPTAFAVPEQQSNSFQTTPSIDHDSPPVEAVPLDVQPQEEYQGLDQDLFVPRSTSAINERPSNTHQYVECKGRQLQAVSSILQGTPFRVEEPTKQAVKSALKKLFDSDFVKMDNDDPDLEMISTYFDRKTSCITTTFYPLQILYGEFELDITLESTISFVLDGENPRVELRLSADDMEVIELKDIRKITMNNSAFIGFPSCLIIDVVEMEEKIKRLSKKYSLFKPTAPEGKQIFNCHPKQLFFVLNTIPEKPHHQCAIVVQENSAKTSASVVASVGFDVLDCEYQLAFATHSNLSKLNIDFCFLTDSNFYDYISHLRLIWICVKGTPDTKWVIKCREDLKMVCDASYVEFDPETGLGYSLYPPTHRFRPLERHSHVTIDQSHACLDGFPIEFRNYAEEMERREAMRWENIQQAPMEVRVVDKRSYCMTFPEAEHPPVRNYARFEKNNELLTPAAKRKMMKKEVPTKHNGNLEYLVGEKPGRGIDEGLDINVDIVEPIDVPPEWKNSTERNRGSRDRHQNGNTKQILASQIQKGKQIEEPRSTR